MYSVIIVIIKQKAQSSSTEPLFWLSADMSRGDVADVIVVFLFDLGFKIFTGSV